MQSVHLGTLSLSQACLKKWPDCWETLLFPCLKKSRITSKGPLFWSQSENPQYYTLRWMVETEKNKWRIDTVIVKSLYVYLCLTWQSSLLSFAIKGKWPSFIQLLCLQGFLSVPCRFTAHREGSFKESLGVFPLSEATETWGLLNDLQLQWVFVIGSISLDLLNLLWISSAY